METFDQLLDQHIQRAGISDSELARTVGVSRQTVFRWRQGHTGRPRFRQDVLAIADKLRLTPAERDALLIAAGFPPPVSSSAGARDDGEPVPVPPDPAASHGHWRVLRWLLVGGILIAVAVGLVVVLPALGPPGAATPSAAAGGGMVVTRPLLPTPPLPVSPAAPGQLLLLVATSADRPPEGQSAGELIAALEREISNNRLLSLGLAPVPLELPTVEGALETGRELNAGMVIHLESGGGKELVARFGRPATNSLSDPVAFGGGSPAELRTLALLGLGQLYTFQSQLDNALPLLAQAHNTLNDTPTAAPETRLQVGGLLCLGYALQAEPVQALAYCQAGGAADANPDLVLGSALARAHIGEFAAAAAELERYAVWLAAQPGEAAGAQLARCRAWIDALESGQNPFVPAVLVDLQDEYVR